MKHRTNLNRVRTVILILLGLTLPGAVHAFVISFTQADFTTNPTFSDVTTFSFAIDIDEPLTAGPYTDPALTGVDYAVNGNLAPDTPSDFPAFALVRAIDGNEFYAQGSSLGFTIAAGADLSDGLQASELADGAGGLLFNGREVGTGRYHPALLQLNNDGTGSIRNSNNTGGVNPGSGEVVDVNFGEEYITELTFDPAQLTLVAAVPIPGAIVGFASAVLVLGSARRRGRVGIKY